MATASTPRGCTLTIASSGTDSNELDLAGPYAPDGTSSHKGPWNLCILAPATVTGTITIQVSDAVGGTYRTFQDPPGTDYTIAAAKAQILRGVQAGALRIHSGSSEGSSRAFVIFGSRAPSWPT
jgi:hypothetical protein